MADVPQNVWPGPRPGVVWVCPTYGDLQIGQPGTQLPTARWRRTRPTPAIPIPSQPTRGPRALVTKAWGRLWEALRPDTPLAFQVENQELRKLRAQLVETGLLVATPYLVGPWWARHGLGGTGEPRQCCLYLPAADVEAARAAIRLQAEVGP